MNSPPVVTRSASCGAANISERVRAFELEAARLELGAAGEVEDPIGGLVAGARRARRELVGVCDGRQHRHTAECTPELSHCSE